MERVDRTIHFIEDVDLQACRSTTNDMLAPWYYRTSMIYLSSSHNFWSSVFATTKPKKKFGFFIKRANGTAAYQRHALGAERRGHGGFARGDEGVAEQSALQRH
jgi:hypothetical protein